MTKEKISPTSTAEMVFDLLYLVFVAAAGVIMLLSANGSTPVVLYGMLALVLGGGDAFHLLPRVYSLYTDTMDAHYKALGFGKLVTSITMTVFYVMLYYVWQQLYQKTLPPWLTGIVFSLAVVRIFLCLLPQNGWFHKTPPYAFGIYRNIPFILLGAIVATLFAKSGVSAAQDGFKLMCPAIILSFVFYLAVVLFSGKHKKLGMLMLPKTCTYIWMICMGFSLL